MDIETAAREMLHTMGNLGCSAHGWQEPRIGTFNTKYGLGVMPDCCCSLIAFPTFYSFDNAWKLLPEEDRPMRSTGIHLKLFDTEGYSPDETAELRQEMLIDYLTEMAKYAYCMEHGSDHKLTIEIEHSDDGSSSFVPHGCCSLFEEAALFFISIHERPYMVPG